jgi:hypothetical protein
MWNLKNWKKIFLDYKDFGIKKYFAKKKMLLGL